MSRVVESSVHCLFYRRTGGQAREAEGRIVLGFGARSKEVFQQLVLVLRSVREKLHKTRQNCVLLGCSSFFVVAAVVSRIEICVAIIIVIILCASRSSTTVRRK